MQITVERLARLIHDSLEVDGWGLIDPDLFEAVALGVDQGDEDAIGLQVMLERVVARLDGE